MQQRHSYSISHSLNCRAGWCAFVFALSFFFSPFTAQAGEKVAEPSELLAKIQNEGSVRVILKIATAGYQQLANQSYQYKSVAPNETAPPQQRDADKDLAAAIEGAASVIFSRTPKAGVEKIHVFATIPYAVARIDRRGLDALYNDPDVLSIQEDKTTPAPRPLPNAERPDPTALATSIPQIGANNAWAQGYTGAGWYAAILDTGIRRTHEFFTGKNIVEACFTSRDSSNPNATLCPNGQNTMYGLGAAAHYSNDDSWHGTHVAGIAAGKKADGSLAGVAKDANIVAVQVFSNGFPSATEFQYFDSDVIKGLEYVYSIRGQYSIAAVNMSMGYRGDPNATACDTLSTKAAIDSLRNVGIATVIATGNDGFCEGISRPACISSSVAVGAVNSTDIRASFSNWFELMVPLFAPGAPVNSATGASDSSYAAYQGTSMAAPHVAGAWVLAKQKMNSAGVDQVLNAFKNTAKSVTFDPCSTPATSTLRIQVDQGLARLNTAAATQADVLLRNMTSGAPGLWFMDGVNRIGWSSMNSVALSWVTGGIGDFNSDGKMDILWRNTSNGQNVVWYMNGSARLGWDYIETVSDLNWAMVGSGDFNGDGKADILWHNTASGRNAVWYMDGKNRSSLDYLPNSSTNWSVGGIADFDSDGKPDILWRDNASGQNAIWLLNNVTMKSWTSITSANSSLYVGGVGDFNNDGKPDILWRNPSNGNNVVWYMNGTSYSSHASIPSASSPWEIRGAGVFH